MTKSTVFIVTTYIKTDDQRKMLEECLQSIHTHYPNAVIQVLDDDHYKEDIIKVPDYCLSEKTPLKQCGEVNAYVWAAKHKDDFDTFVYIHDSVKLINPLPLDSDISFRSLWYASVNIHLDINDELVDEFMCDFLIDNTNCLNELYMLRIHIGSMSFGAMGIWDRKFCDFLISRTNFLDLVHKLNTRRLRCFFERLIYILDSKYEGYQDPIIFMKKTICGDIYHHQDGFSNKSFDIPNPGNPYVVKVWNGR